MSSFLFHGVSLGVRRMTPKQRAMQAPLILGGRPDARIPKQIVDCLNKQKGKTHGKRMEELVSLLGRSLALWAEIMDKGKADERVLATTVVELWSLGSLRQVRLCEKCNKKWFVGGHKNYRFCGSTCRAAFFRSTEQGKAKSRIRQRKYRENLKRKELNELKIR